MDNSSSKEFFKVIKKHFDIVTSLELEDEYDFYNDFWSYQKQQTSFRSHM